MSTKRYPCDCEMGYWQGRCICCDAQEHITSELMTKAKRWAVMLTVLIGCLLLGWRLSEWIWG